MGENGYKLQKLGKFYSLDKNIKSLIKNLIPIYPDSLLSMEYYKKKDEIEWYYNFSSDN